MLGTVAGQVMGTAGYMAPEQARGAAEIDHRADLFAFGCLLHEMASGRRAFSGRSVAETLSQIQHEEPSSLTTANASLPAELQRIVNKSLAKDPDERYQHADDLIVDIRGLAREVDAGTAATPGAAASDARPAVSDPGVAAAEAAGDPSSTGGARGVPVAAVALLTIAVVALTAAAMQWWPTSPTADATAEIHFEIELPENAKFTRGWGNQVASSPDGQTVAYFLGGRLGDEAIERIGIFFSGVHEGKHFGRL